MRLCSCVVKLLVRWLRSCSRRRRNCLPWRLQELLSYTRLIINSLCYNSLLNCDLVTDSLFEPVFWMVDIITRWFGMVSLTLGFLFYGNYILVHNCSCDFLSFAKCFLFPLLQGLCVSSDSSHQLCPLSRLFLPPPFGP